MSQKEILQNPMVKQLIKTFDLQPPLRTEHSLNVTNFELENGFIVINEIELLNSNGEHIKNLDPDDVAASLDQFVVTFRMKR